MHCLLAEHPSLHTECGKRAFRRVTDAGIIILALLYDSRIVTKHGRKYKRLENTLDLNGLAAFVNDIALRCISAAFHIVFFVTVVEDLYGHLVLRKRSCLV